MSINTVSLLWIIYYLFLECIVTEVHLLKVISLNQYIQIYLLYRVNLLYYQISGVFCNTQYYLHFKRYMSASSIIEALFAKSPQDNL